MRDLMLGAAQSGSKHKENKNDRVALQMPRTELTTCTFKLWSRRPLLCSALVCYHTCGQAGVFRGCSAKFHGNP